MNGETILTMRDIVKCYQMGEEEQMILKHIDFSMCRGEFVSILGPSGSGKSTMMNIIGCLDVPTSGSYILSGQDTSDMDEEELAHIRNREIGFIFQSFQLLPRLNALENVELPLVYAGVSPSERRRRAKAVLERVGLENKMKNYPNQLSGGQQQRVAIARALAMHPDILCFDEPTSALDPELTGEVLRVIRGLAEQKTTMLIVTHEMAFARDVADRVIFMDGGVVVEQGPSRDVIEHPQQERTRQFLARYAENEH